MNSIGKAVDYFSEYSFYTGRDKQMTDVLTAAHHGLISLESDDMQAAIAAGNYLCDAMQTQPNLDKGFYLRIEKDNPVTQFAAEQTPLYFINQQSKNGLWHQEADVNTCYDQSVEIAC